MSGLFRRLARHATGQSPATVHAVARLPFQAPPELRPTEEGVAPLMAPVDGADASRGGAPAVPMPATATEAPPHQLTPRSDTSAPTRAQIPPRVRTPQRTTDSAAAPTSTPTPARRARARASVTDRAQPGRDPRGADTHDAVRAETPSVPDRLLDPVAAATVEVASPRTGEQGALGATLTIALPAPLLPTQTTSAEPSPSKPVLATATARPAPEPTEVHVHIGRIEVTAVQAPAPAKRPARTGQAPMSLDAYLAKRQRSPS
ncbi:hypothetical protein O4G98_05090 [Zoogloeaceae bacterium G21618-S1]|nr:hypothetical protein [Zoogloeaceae bacterium G21618-S1]